MKASRAVVTGRGPRRAARAAALVSVVALAVAACGGGSTPTNTAKAPDDKKITLKINFWGDFGFKQLAPEYKKLHPNVTLVLNAGDYNQQHQDLQKFLVAGSGAAPAKA